MGKDLLQVPRFYLRIGKDIQRSLYDRCRDTCRYQSSLQLPGILIGAEIRQHVMEATPDGVTCRDIIIFGIL